MSSPTTTNARQLKYYYWGHPIIPNCYNFGDFITPVLLSHYCRGGAVKIARNATDADIFACGSVIEHIPDVTASVFILGSGLIKKGQRRFPNAIIYALRGELTKAELGIQG